MLRRVTVLCIASFVAAPILAADAPADSPPLRLLTSDVMNALIQPRHAKLGLAGQAGNWDFADYERRNLQGALRRWAAAIPDYQGQKVADMIQGTVAEPLAQLDAAIKTHDATAFRTAYQALNEGCNACHAGTGNSQVVIKVPDAGAFPDQDFAPRAGG